MTPKKYPQNFKTPKNICFSEIPKNIEIQNFEPKKMDRAYVCMKISEYPPPPPLHLPQLDLGRLELLFYTHFVYVLPGIKLAFNNSLFRFNTYSNAFFA